MRIRVLQHIIFWAAIMLLYVIQNMLFAAPSDLEHPPVWRFLRFFFNELCMLPWKALPFYFLFYYLIPKYFYRGGYWQTGLLFLLGIVICVLGYRTMIWPMSRIMYGDTPSFNVYSPKRMLFTLIDVLSAVGLASAVKLLKGSIASRQKEKLLQEEKRKSELNFLKAQTNPHFLFNSLNNLYGLARRNDDNTANAIMKLSNLMRYILYECSEGTLPVRNEVSIIEDYIQLEKLRYDNRLQVRFIKSVDNWKQSIPPLILLPFVENAFKHGAGETRFDVYIDIYLDLRDEQLRFRVENSREEEEEVLREGIGLKNVKRQLELIYGKDHSLKIDPASDKFTVELLIQLNHHDGY